MECQSNSHVCYQASISYKSTCSKYPLAGQDQYTRATLNAVSWVEMMTKWQMIWRPFSITAERIPRSIFGVNLVILAQIHYKLSRRKAKFPRIQSQNGQNDLEGQSQWPPFSIPAESIPGCMFGAHLVIVAQICDELSCGQGKVYEQTDGRRDVGNDNTSSTWKVKG